MTSFFLYVASCPSYGTHDCVKIGVSKNPKARVRQLKTTHDHLLELKKVYLPDDAYTSEADIKRKFRDSRRAGHEFFSINLSDVVAYIENDMGLVSCQK